MNENWVDFKEVKDTVPLASVLDRYGVKLKRVNATSLRGKCPLPSHTSETNNSFGVDTKKNAWSCQSKSCAQVRGRRGGNTLDFVAVMENCSVRDAALKLQVWFLGGESSATDHTKKTEPAATPPKKETGELAAGMTTVQPSDNESVNDGSDGNKPLAFVLKDVDTTYPYLTKRGITKETAATFGVGFFPGKGTMAGRIVIPIHNVKGELVAYAGRSIDGGEPKYKLPAGFKKSAELFNLHRAIKTDNHKTGIVVEGFFDTMKVHQAGFSNVVGLMGSSLSAAQAHLLATYFDSVVVMLDGDEAGKQGTQELIPKLSDNLWIRIVHLADSVQPDRLSSDQLRSILSPVIKSR